MDGSDECCCGQVNHAYENMWATIVKFDPKYIKKAADDANFGKIHMRNTF